MNELNLLRGLIAQAAQSHFGIPVDLEFVQLDLPPDNIPGDLACPCFPFAKVFKRSPQQVALELAEALADRPELESAEAAGPYLNLKLNLPFWAARLVPAALRDPDQADSLRDLRLPMEQRERVVVEFSCPNTNKPQHLGHVRNNILGEALARLLGSQGHEVIRQNLINDRGIHICKSMLAWQKWGQGETPESTGEKGDHLVGRYYVLFAEKMQEEMRDWAALRGQTLPLGEAEAATFEADSILMTEARRMLLAWEADDADVRSVWTLMNSWVLAGFEETYARMGIRFDRLDFESQIWTLGKDLVDAGLNSGKLKTLEGGAVVCPLDELGMEPKVLRRSDGTSIYMTQDLGNAVKRHRELAFDRMIYVVGSEQEHHFRVLFHILKHLGYAWADRLSHYSYGMVNLTTGRMKSREGRVVDADDLLDELEAASLRILEESERRSEMSDKQKGEVVRAVALGALKYFILRVTPTQDMIYDPEESINLAGNTGPYLQYARARIASLASRSGVVAAEVTRFDLLKEPEERDLLRRLLLWPREISLAAEQLNPARVAQRTYELARAFSRLFNTHSIVDRVENQELARQRVALCAAVGAVLQQGLNLMGVDAPERL